MIQDQDVALGGFGGSGPRTVFQVGSVTKVFTALVLADLAERGQLAPSDPAAKYLPGATGPATLADLATHTSGLSRLPLSLRLSALASPHDPYARYPATQFVRDARRALRTASPGAYAYSNFGYGVLGYLLGQAAASTYQALVTERICQPLGLADTTFEPPAPSQESPARKTPARKTPARKALARKAPARKAPARKAPARAGRATTAPTLMAQGHRRGRPVPVWHMGSLAAAGGLYSTAADLATLLQACLTASQQPPIPESGPPRVPEPRPGPETAPVPSSASRLAAVIRATLAPRRKIPGGEIGLAWHHTHHGNHRIIWHNGMTGGFSSMIAFDPARRMAIAALANAAADIPPLNAAVLGAFGE